MCQNLALTVLYVPRQRTWELTVTKESVGYGMHASGLVCLICGMTVLYMPWLSYVCHDCLICTMAVLYVSCLSYMCHHGLICAIFATLARKRTWELMVTKESVGHVMPRIK